ncbi:ABC transporter permease%2C cobalt transport [Streptococcus pneumoniae]|nr:ABC transporter permease%2C cobalt transport [Streptococcus pneumoniae]CIW11115.1 ABC transporter permease%2C cobalt transport [Streptococcus pneumoniae]CIW17072.1 ABC transporter permease%2C cobalt transport [Streptococcus pneumoniae]CIW22140.1 ABC transporter permease%2C cobalt transport [Streptococcus pneumoniae]CIW48400.1 ABC transporter permease%2C cobalt transport [Streptococcus pneumoniae]
MDFGEGSIVQKVKAMIPILIPLFATSLKRADSLAIAMEARGYQGGKGRSQYRQLKWTLKDTLTILVILVLGCCLFFLKS